MPISDNFVPTSVPISDISAHTAQDFSQDSANSSSQIGNLHTDTANDYVEQQIQQEQIIIHETGPIIQPQLPTVPVLQAEDARPIRARNPPSYLSIYDVKLPPSIAQGHHSANNISCAIPGVNYPISSFLNTSCLSQVIKLSLQPFPN